MTVEPVVVALKTVQVDQIEDALSLISSTEAFIANLEKFSPETHVTLNSSLVVGAVVVTGAFWVGRFMQRVDDRLRALEDFVGVPRKTKQKE